MKITVNTLRRVIRECIVEATGKADAVYVKQPRFFEDGKRSFWTIEIGVKSTVNTKRINAVLKNVPGGRIFSDKFSAPYKSDGDLRKNRISSDYVDGPDHEVADQLKKSVDETLTKFGFTVLEWPK